jgi:hypothetical protein
MPSASVTTTSKPALRAGHANLVESHTERKAADRYPGGLRYSRLAPTRARESDQSHTQRKAADRNPGGLRYKTW